MGIFSRMTKPPSVLPEDAPAKLDAYGRAEGPLQQEGDPAGAVMLMEPIRKGLADDHDHCLKELYAAARQGGGWALYAVVEILDALHRSSKPSDQEILRGENGLLNVEGDLYLEIVDAAILFMRKEDCPSASLTDAMRDRWVAAEGALFLYDNLDEVSPSAAVDCHIADLGPEERRLLVRHQYPFDPGGVEEVALVKTANGVSLVGTLDGRQGVHDTWRMTPEFVSPLEAVSCLGAEIRCDRGVLWMHDDVRPHLTLRDAHYSPKKIGSGS